MRKLLTAILMVAATSAAASDIPWSDHATDVLNDHTHLSDVNYQRDHQYEVDLINRLSSDGTTLADINECNSWYHTDKVVNYTSDFANTSGCHFILHAISADLIDGYTFHPDINLDQYLGFE